MLIFDISSTKMSDSMSAIEYEGLEQKYMETKSKLKKTLQYNERYTIQIQKLNKRLKRLENENKQLEFQVNQLQSTARDTSESDVSSPADFRQEHSSMIDLIHSKNQQISDILKDIEEGENENILLREKLAETKDQLAIATAEITETVRVEGIRIQQRDATIEKISTELDQLKQDLDKCDKEKDILKEKLEIITKEAKEKELESKILLDEKDREIEKLKKALPVATSSQVISKNDVVLEKESQTAEVNNLKATLMETETLLKTEMQNCTVELQESATIINKLKAQRDQLEQKILGAKENEKEMKQQLKKAHERCENLHKEVEYANKLTKIFETELSSIKERMKENGQLQLVQNLDEVQALKIEKLLHEKHIVGLVKDINKLQEMCNIFEIENVSLRQQLGLASEDVVDIDPNILKESRQQRKLIDKLKLENSRSQEDNVKLKLELKSLKRQVSALMQNSANTQDESKVGVEKRPPSNQIKEDRSADVKALCEENEALRKGLHEILNSVQVKNETSPRELRSEVLERLLKALDVKHISGWYHPAMRLQAELHTLEGVNIELREQLQAARIELDKYKSFPTPREDSIDNSSKVKQKGDTNESMVENSTGILCDLLSNDTSCIEKLKINVIRIVLWLIETETVDIDKKLESEFEYCKRHINLIHKNCNSEKAQLLENLKNAESTIIASERPLLDAKTSSEELTKLIEIERRKANYIFEQKNKLQEEHATIKLNNNYNNKHHLLELDSLVKKLVVLRSKLNFRDQETLTLVKPETFKDVQNSLNENVKKYRQVLAQIGEVHNQRALEIDILMQKESDLVKENNELKDSLNKAVNKLSQETYTQEQNVLPLSQQLANAEVQALSEKHRADHTNNLYELVKEQLKKSEEKFVEFSKYSDGLLQKNLVLQERVVVLEDQLTVCVDPELYKELQDNVNSLIKEKEQLVTANGELARKCHELDDSTNYTSTWTKEKEQELLGLRHEIIDITATSDDKTVIDQLYCDLTKLRSELRDKQMQVDFLRREISNWESRFANLCTEMEGQRRHFEVERKVLDKRIGILQDVVLKQRIQYHGCIPLTIQELFVEKLQTLREDKHAAFLLLQNAKVLGDKMQSSQKSVGIGKSLPHEACDCKNQQIQYLQHKIQNQDRDLEKLEKELFSAYKLMDFNRPAKDVSAIRKRAPVLVRQLVSQESLDPVVISDEIKNGTSSQRIQESRIIMLRNVETQTGKLNEEKENNQLTMARVQLNNLQNQLSIKDNYIAENERSINEKDKELAETKEQLKELNNQVTSLQSSLKTIQDLGKMQTGAQHNGGAGDGAGPKTNFLDEQIIGLRASLKEAQAKTKQKDIEIMKYQTLLKEDRDKHSLAAANLQQELIVLRKALFVEQQNLKSLQQESIISRQKSVAVEKYVTQVRALEKHLAELHTQLTHLQAQLQNALQESTRWRQMAQDRLVAMQELGKSLNDQHNKELSSYKTDYEKLKELSEEEPSKKPLPERKHVGYIDPEVLKLCREKDGKIEELTAKLKQLESGETLEKQTSPDYVSGKETPPDVDREQEMLRTKYKSMVTRERSLKEEIRDLKEQLSKKSNLSARGQKSERMVKEHLQKRINSLERDVESLNDKLVQQQLVNEKHKLYASEDFEKWKKQKYWQENCQKYKNKSQEKEEEVQKLQQTCAGYRMLIERLEREKINLESRIKTLKSDQRNLISDRERIGLKEENERLACELATLQAKMEMRQQGAGALGAALMQEKLEAQERKIAVLELSAKGSVEVRNELERLHSSLANSQKNNLCLEAENLEYKMDLEKYVKEYPHLQEQIQHLESYVELLKDENKKQTSNAADVPRASDSSEDKKASQLERTVFVLKRVVERLQVENKRLVTGKKPLSAAPPEDKVRRDYHRLKEQHTRLLQKLKGLESQQRTTTAGADAHTVQKYNEMIKQLHSTLEEVKEQLRQKTRMLDKMKALLHNAVAREKQLLQEVAELKGQVNEEKDYQVDIPSTIEEVSEASSDG